MKYKQITAILLSAVMALSPCVPASSINVLAAENAAAESTETAAEAEIAAEAETEAETATESEIEAEAATETEIATEAETAAEAESEAAEEDPEESGVNEEADPGSDAEDEIVIEEPAEQFAEIEGKQAGSVIDSGKCGDSAQWTITDEGGEYTLTISGTGNVNPGYGEAAWEQYKPQVKKAVVEEGITYLESYAFTECVNLESIELPDSLTGVGEVSFDNCKSLKGITIPKNVEYWFDMTFRGCSSLEYINADPENEKYRSVDGVLFNRPTSNYDVSILYRYPGVKADTYYEVPDGVNEIGKYAFSFNSNLENIDLPETLRAEGIGDHAFDYCTALKKIAIPEGITQFHEDVFSHCESLTDITLPESLSYLGDGTFAGCSSLEHIELPSDLKKLSSNREIGGAFSSSGIKDITIPKHITDIPADTFYECSKLETVILPDNLLVIGDAAFYSTAVKKITFPQFLQEIGNRVFWGCYDLKEMVFTGNAPYFDSNCFTSAVTAVAFYPPEDPSWTEDVRKDYGGEITWLPYGTEIAEEITLDNVPASLKKGDSVKLKATVLPADAVDAEVKWSTYDKNVVSIASDGTIKALSEGTATIVATTGYKGLKATCTIKVENPVQLGKTARGDMFNLANNVKVTWKEVPGAKYYKVYRSGVKEPVIVTTGTVGWDKAPGLINGQTYTYRIVASTTGKGDSSGDSKLSYSKVMYRLQTTAFKYVKNMEPGKVTVSYKKSAYGDSYVLLYADNKDMKNAKSKVIYGADTTAVTLNGFKKGKTYWFQIRVRKSISGFTLPFYTTFGVQKSVSITK